MQKPSVLKIKQRNTRRDIIKIALMWNRKPGLNSSKQSCST